MEKCVRGLVEVKYWNFPRRIEENHEKAVVLADNFGQIRTKHLQDEIWVQISFIFNESSQVHTPAIRTRQIFKFLNEAQS